MLRTINTKEVKLQDIELSRTIENFILNENVTYTVQKDTPNMYIFF